MSTENTLEFLKDHFYKAELDCEIVELGDIGKRRLLVFLGTDHHDCGLSMEVTAQEIALEGKLFSPAVSKDQAYVRIQFDVSYPFVVRDESTLDVAQFLHFLDLQIELPGFYLNPLDNRILYRYVWLCKPGDVHPKLALNIVAMVMFFQGAFESILEKLASGEESYLSLLEEIVRSFDTQDS
jgi:hypothetical protein